MNPSSPEDQEAAMMMLQQLMQSGAMSAAESAGGFPGSGGGPEMMFMGPPAQSAPGRPVVTGRSALLAGEGIDGIDDEDEEDFEETDDDDETLLERVMALNEMFPESLRSLMNTSFELSFKISASSYRYLRIISWFLVTTGALLVFPIMIERERYDFMKAEQKEQHGILLGPKATATGRSPLPPGLTLQQR